MNTTIERQGQSRSHLTDKRRYLIRLTRVLVTGDRVQEQIMDNFGNGYTKRAVNDLFRVLVNDLARTKRWQEFDVSPDDITVTKFEGRDLGDNAYLATIEHINKNGKWNRPNWC